MGEKDLEILAPVGSAEMLRYAINAGTDAVYFGLKDFNCRQKAQSVDDENIAEWLDLCHKFGVKAYVAVNTLIKNEEMDNVISGIVNAKNLGADAFIMQDIGLMKAVSTHYPQIAIHASTQAGTTSLYGANFLKNNFGVKRVILSRECSKQEVIEICHLDDMQVEVFAHGALCVGFSGNCYMSSFLSENSGNRGRCLQLCRKEYSAMDSKMQYKNAYYLSPKDLCLVEYVNQLKMLGVDSLKIEGRNKRPEYVAQTVHCYKKAINGEKITEKDINDLKSIYNRGDFTKGYMFFENTKDLMFKDVQGHKGLNVGRVKAVEKEGVLVNSKIKLSNGDGFKIFRQIDASIKEVGNAVFLRAIDDKANFYKLKQYGDVKVGDLINVTTSTVQNKFLASLKDERDKTVNLQNRVGIDYCLTLKNGQVASLTAKSEGFESTAQSEEIVSQSKNAPLTPQGALEKLSKLNDTIFSVNSFYNEIDENIFVSGSTLNKLRRTVCGDLQVKIENVRKKLNKKLCPIMLQQSYVLKYKDLHKFNLNKNDESFEQPKIALIFDDFAKIDSSMCDIVQSLIYNPKKLAINEMCLGNGDPHIVEFLKKNKVFLSLPHFLNLQNLIIIKEFIKNNNFAGIYANSLSQIELAKELGVEVFGGNLNIMNIESVKLLDLTMENITLSNELNNDGIMQISNYMAEKNAKLPYVNLFGAIKLMELHFCPHQNVTGASNCQDCQYDDTLKLKDEKNAEFPICRSKLATCVFSLQNNKIQNVFAKEYPTNCNYIVNLSGINFSNKQVKQILDNISKQQIFEIDEIMQGVESTYGHYYRGVK